MAEISDTSIAPASSSAEVAQPVPAADDQKSGATPASGADDQNSETAADTPEQIAAKAESRRARSNARKAQALADARAEAKLLREERDRLLSERRPAQGSDEPKRESFDDLETYYRAVARYEAKQATAETVKAEREAQQGREQQDRQSKTQAELAKNWTTREAEFQKATKDYEAVVAPFADDELQDLHQAARTAIVESENGPALLYHLATHTEEAERIATLSPTRQIAELGKLETQLGKVVKPSNAPAPATPIGQGKSGSKDPSKMTDSEYRTFRKAQGARWAQ